MRAKKRKGLEARVLSQLGVAKRDSWSTVHRSGCDVAEDASCSQRETIYNLWKVQQSSRCRSLVFAVYKFLPQ